VAVVLLSTRVFSLCCCSTVSRFKMAFARPCPRKVATRGRIDASQRLSFDQAAGLDKEADGGPSTSYEAVSLHLPSVRQSQKTQQSEWKDAGCCKRMMIMMMLVRASWMVQ